MKIEDTAYRFKLMLDNLKILFWLVAGCVAVWEFWPFNNGSNQTLAFTSHVYMEKAVLKSINIVEFEVSVDQQRVIQKVVSPVTRGSRIPLCSFFGIACKDPDPRPKPPLIEGMFSDVKRSKISELRLNLPDKAEALTELQGCTVKSTEDWICKSSWYKSQDEEISDHFVGKSGGEWISNPLVFNSLSWKSVLLFEKLRCGELCYVTTRQKYNEIQADNMRDIDRILFGSKN